jgi:DNA-binding transcriptional LysR family regulator
MRDANARTLRHSRDKWRLHLQIEERVLMPRRVEICFEAALGILVQSDLAVGRLVRSLPNEIECVSEYFLVWKSHSSQLPQMKLLCDWLKTERTLLRFGTIRGEHLRLS